MKVGALGYIPNAVLYDDTKINSRCLSYPALFK